MPHQNQTPNDDVAGPKDAADLPPAESDEQPGPPCEDAPVDDNTRLVHDCDWQRLEHATHRIRLRGRRGAA